MSNLWGAVHIAGGFLGTKKHPHISECLRPHTYEPQRVITLIYTIYYLYYECKLKMLFIEKVYGLYIMNVVNDNYGSDTDLRQADFQDIGVEKVFLPAKISGDYNNELNGT